MKATKLQQFSPRGVNAVHLGFTSMNTPEDLGPGELGSALEARGFESLWVGEHSHIPVARTTPYPAGGELPPQYLRMMDPFISLMHAASATTTLRLGTGVALVLEHDLFALAKTVATLDRLCDGRFEFGVGVGWNEEELANHRPIKWSQRYRALAESVSALRALWGDEASEFHGDFYNFDPVWSQPAPVQLPHPPILCGMAGRLGTQHAIEWADAWMPMDSALGNVARRVEKFREDAAATGRSPIAISMVAWGDPTLQTLQEYRDLGIERVVLGAGRVGWNDPTTSMPFIDRYTPFVDQLR